MKSTGVLINIGRGPIVDEDALIQALKGLPLPRKACYIFMCMCCCCCSMQIRRFVVRYWTCLPLSPCLRSPYDVFPRDNAHQLSVCALQTSELYKLDNVLMSPHNADRTTTSVPSSIEFFLENLQEWIHGRPLLSLVDKQAGY